MWPFTKKETDSKVREGLEHERAKLIVELDGIFANSEIIRFRLRSMELEFALAKKEGPAEKIKELVKELSERRDKYEKTQNDEAVAVKRIGRMINRIDSRLGIKKKKEFKRPYDFKDLFPKLVAAEVLIKEEDAELRRVRKLERMERLMDKFKL